MTFFTKRGDDKFGNQLWSKETCCWEQNELGEGGWWDRTHVDKAISDVRPGDAVC